MICLLHQYLRIQPASGVNSTSRGVQHVGIKKMTFEMLGLLRLPQTALGGSSRPIHSLKLLTLTRWMMAERNMKKLLS